MDSTPTTPAAPEVDAAEAALATRDWAALVEISIQQALRIGDPAERARAITGILGAVKDANPDLKAARQADVLILREDLTLREVGEKIGVKTARVDQIAKGK
jgi:hypothetical protein